MKEIFIIKNKVIQPFIKLSCKIVLKVVSYIYIKFFYIQKIILL